MLFVSKFFKSDDCTPATRYRHVTSPGISPSCSVSVVGERGDLAPAMATLLSPPPGEVSSPDHELVRESQIRMTGCAVLRKDGNQFLC